MTYNQKSNKLRELFYRANREGLGLDEFELGLKIMAGEYMPSRWRNPQELSEYLEKFGGQIKTNKKRKKGYLIVHLQGNLYAEVPMDFAERALVLGGFP